MLHSLDTFTTQLMAVAMGWVEGLFQQGNLDRAELGPVRELWGGGRNCWPWEGREHFQAPLGEARGWFRDELALRKAQVDARRRFERRRLEGQEEECRAQEEERRAEEEARLAREETEARRMAELHPWDEIARREVQRGFEEAEEERQLEARRLAREMAIAARENDIQREADAQLRFG